MSALSVVTRERLADTETAVSAYLKLCGGRSDSFLLESAETHEIIGRYSIIAFDPLTALELWPDTVRLTDAGGERRSSRPENFSAWSAGPSRPTPAIRRSTCRPSVR